MCSSPQGKRSQAEGEASRMGRGEVEAAGCPVVGRSWLLAWGAQWSLGFVLRRR